MKRIWIAAAMVATTIGFQAHAAKDAPAVTRDDPRLVCESGNGFGYGHPSAACWWAYDAALARHDYEEALSAVRTGCDKYGRVDFCTFMGTLDVARARPLRTSTAVERYILVRELERAELVVTPMDITDAEAAVVMREQAAKPVHRADAAPAPREVRRASTRIQPPG